jgi:vacuolar protein sorting-associated protein 13A/C
METDIIVEGQNRQLSLSVHVDRSHSLDLYVYSPYWIVNKTGLPVQIRVCPKVQGAIDCAISPL